MNRGKMTLFMLSILITLAYCQQFQDLSIISTIKSIANIFKKPSSSSSSKQASTSSSKAGTATSSTSSSKGPSTTSSSKASSSSNSGNTSSTSSKASSSSTSKATTSSTTSSSSSSSTTTYNSANYYPIYNCSGNIQRIKNGASINWASIVNGSTAYTDTAFPTSTALQWGYPYNDGTFNGTGYLSSIPFYRARNNLTTTPTLFSGTVTGDARRNEVDQRELGDCYFLDSCSEVANSSARIEDIFLTQTYNTNGIFAAELFIKGIATVVTVDDYLPFDGNYTDTMVFAIQDVDGSIWSSILEKMWAKVNGNYQNIQAGNSAEVFDFLVGAPVKQFWMTTDMGYSSSSSSTKATAANNVWSTIVPAIDAGYLVAVGTSDSTVDDLVSDHAYSVLNAFSLTNSTATYRLFQIRNPWGLDQYTGLWRDADQGSWTTSFETTTGFVNSSIDGINFISVEDFVLAFDTFQIGYYTSGYVNNYYEVTSDDSTLKYFTFTLTNTYNEVYVMTEFYNPRMYPYGCRSSSEYTTGSMSLYKSDGVAYSTNITIYDDRQNEYYVHYTNLTAGTYIVKVYVGGWQTNDVRDYTVRVYGNVTTTITQMETTSISSFVSTIFSTVLSAGTSGLTSLSTQSGTQYQINYGMNGDVAYVELKPLVSCSVLSMTLTLKGGSSAPTTSPSSLTCTYSSSTGYYACSCDLSSTGNSKCAFAYSASYVSYALAGSMSC